MSESKKEENQIQEEKEVEFRLEDVPKLDEFYGALVIGPSGSGKTSLCLGLQQFYQLLQRDHAIINLDPANETMKYECAIDIKDLINLEDVMEELNLGPNGGLLYCMQFIEDNIDWLKERISKLKNKYLIFDLPGQIELYMASDHIKNIISMLKRNDCFESEFTIVELFDSTYCYDYSNYVSLTLQALVSFLTLELPHINVLSKIDLMKEYGKPQMSLDHYLDAYDISLIYKYDSAEYKKRMTHFEKKHYQLNKKLAELIDEFKLVSFTPLSIENKLLMSKLVYNIDKSNGYLHCDQFNNEKFQEIRASIAETNQVYSVNERIILENELFGDQDEKLDMEKEFAKYRLQDEEEQKELQKKGGAEFDFEKDFSDNDDDDDDFYS